MTKIEWTGETWNPVVGCSIVSPGCTNCYAMGQAGRIQRMTPDSHYLGTTQTSKAGDVWTGVVKLAPDHILMRPLRWTKPRTIFVNSMGDLFHEDVPDAWIDLVFAMMAATCDASQTGGDEHTYQILTKRSARMRVYMAHPDREAIIDEAVEKLAAAMYRHEPFARKRPRSPFYGGVDNWPLPNVWLGVSAERQIEADARIPDLLSTPAAVRFVSAEPLLGPINFRSIDVSGDEEVLPLGAGYLDRLEPGENEGPRLDWIIVGGESGRSARPMHPSWARGIRDQCNAAGVAFFFKQWGSHARAADLLPGDHLEQDADLMLPTNKARAGRLLDGREWLEMPTAQAQKDRAA